MTDSGPCVVCDEAANERNASVCNACGERFHLNQRNDADGRDCGAVWINEQYLALEFACQRCLDGATPTAKPKPRIRRSQAGHRRYRRRE